MTVLVRFEAEVRLLDDEVPATLDYRPIGQAIQDAIGHSGVSVIEVTDWEDESA